MRIPQRTRRPAIWLALYRRLARAYPRLLRRDLGVEMESLFLDLHGEARELGRGHAHWFALRACAETLPRAFQAHGDPESPTGAFLVRTFFSDLRFAWLAATRDRRHSAIVALTVAIGVAATTTVFSVTDAAIIRQLPFPDAERLVEAGHFVPNGGFTIASLDAAAFRAWSEHEELFDTIGGVSWIRRVAWLGDEPHSIEGAAISPSLLTSFGARPLQGRLFVDEDAAAGAPPVVMLAESLWKEQFGETGDLAAARLTLDGVDHDVVGVLADAFAFPTARVRLWVPADPTVSGRMRAYARLAPGVDLEQASAMADVIAAGLQEQNPQPLGWQLKLVSLEQHRASERTRKALWLALAAAGMLLLIACVNVAQVALARAVHQEAELSVRAALGAGRGRIMRQVVLQSIFVCCSGGLLGALVAAWCVHAIGASTPDGLVRFDSVRFVVEWRALAFASFVSIASGLAAGIAPAWTASRSAGGAILHAMRPAMSTSGPRKRLQSGLIVLEAALSLILLAGAGLLLHSFDRLTRVDPGFDADRIVSVVLELDADRYPTTASRQDFLDGYALRVRSIPGVVAASAAGAGMPNPGGTMLASSLEGENGAHIEQVLVPYGYVGDGFFATVGTEVLDGRPLQTSDSGTRNAVISAAMAQRLFGDEPAVGRRFRLDDDEEWSNIVGVAETTSALALSGSDDDLQMYLPLMGESTPRSYCALLVRADVDPGSLVPALRQALWAIDSEQAVHDIVLASDSVDAWVIGPRFYTLLLGVFAAAALLLVLVGVAGVVGHSIASRTREIGIRVAVGASDRSVLALALAGGLRPAIIGLVLGGIVALQLSSLLEAQLYDITPTDPLNLLQVGLLFLGATLVASYIPARRVLKIDPVQALRTE